MTSKLATLADNLQLAYLDYLNNYLTLAHFAELNEIPVNEANAIITAGRSIHVIRTEPYQEPKA